ncbi:hypothetical protein KFE96_05020 [Kordiimonas sp. SCSIO 12603]|uniref:hypothetical protein n=1 Tax=Kordiimonas sp. SCSIO 12603 TaxID=2829596 RepID=UPI0021061C57|nr:hypothetical protein [Kordiimonas sp. SCSIO 12603]UTW59668.1 hypothetical protein KFE96_05020 [Kordiimonas sp. SCSIO 12603]
MTRITISAWEELELRTHELTEKEKMGLIDFQIIIPDNAGFSTKKKYEIILAIFTAIKHSKKEAGVHGNEGKERITKASLLRAANVKETTLKNPSHKLTRAVVDAWLQKNQRPSKAILTKNEQTELAAAKDALLLAVEQQNIKDIENRQLRQQLIEKEEEIVRLNTLISTMNKTVLYPSG